MKNDIGLRLELVLERVPSETKIDKMMDEINQVANQYGYKVRVRGFWWNFIKLANEEKAYIDEMTLRMKNHEFD